MLKLCETEFDDDLFVLRQLDPLDQAHQQLLAGAGSIQEALHQLFRSVLMADGTFLLLLQVSDAFFLSSSFLFNAGKDTLKVRLWQKPGKPVGIHPVKIFRQACDLALQGSFLLLRRFLDCSLRHRQ